MATASISTFWRHASGIAERTPERRNRYVDFLRAASILVVVFGHWLMAAPHVANGDLVPVNLLRAEPWTHWLTWIFQVMPIFFMVGGYANAASWQSAANPRYAEWLTARLRRLVLPAVPLVVTWSGVALAARLIGIDGSLLRIGSQSALIPLWFLAVYVVVVALTPVTNMLWRRYGWASFAAIAAAAIVIDVGRFHGPELVGWANFVFVWSAVHQLGYAWHDRRFGTPVTAAAVGGVGLAALTLLVTVGPYPVAMVGVPGADITNNSPPTIALIALGLFQTGLLLAMERPMRRWLRRARVWSGAVALNGVIMTVYLWHLTVMVLVVGVSLAVGGLGLGAAPASAEWWATRPIWITLLTMLSIPIIAVMMRHERPSETGGAVSPTMGLLAAGLACLGFANIAGGGIGNGEVWLRPLAVVPVLLAAIVLRPTASPRQDVTGEPRPV